MVPVELAALILKWHAKSNGAEEPTLRQAQPGRSQQPMAIMASPYNMTPQGAGIQGMGANPLPKKARAAVASACGCIWMGSKSQCVCMVGNGVNSGQSSFQPVKARMQNELAGLMQTYAGMQMESQPAQGPNVRAPDTLGGAAAERSMPNAGYACLLPQHTDGLHSSCMQWQW